jgi:hypothetical protein
MAVSQVALTAIKSHKWHRRRFTTDPWKERSPWLVQAQRHPSIPLTASWATHPPFRRCARKSTTSPPSTPSAAP